MQHIQALNTGMQLPSARLGRPALAQVAGPRGPGVHRGKDARPCFERLCRDFGRPRDIRDRNGVPLASCGLHGLSQLNVLPILPAAQLASTRQPARAEPAPPSSGRTGPTRMPAGSRGACSGLPAAALLSSPGLPVRRLDTPGWA